MFKQIHRVPGKTLSISMTLVVMLQLHQCLWNDSRLVLHLCLWVFVCTHRPQCVFCHSPYSEPVEENPYRPTYIFPESYDRPLKTRGTINSCHLLHLLNLTLSAFPSHSACQVLTLTNIHWSPSAILLHFQSNFQLPNIADEIEKMIRTESNTGYPFQVS